MTTELERSFLQRVRVQVGPDGKILYHEPLKIKKIPPSSWFKEHGGANKDVFIWLDPKDKSFLGVEVPPNGQGN